MKDSSRLKRIAKFLSIIGEKNRLTILYCLKDGEQCVCQIQKSLRQPQNLVSHHLRVLKKSGLVSSRKDGLNVYYTLNRDALGANRAFFAETFGIKDR